MHNALVLVIDRLGTGYLGPYGNTWIETPAWNRLAARSVLVETSLVDSPDLTRLYHSYWQGRHALSAQHAQGVPVLADVLAGHDVETWVVTDEPAVANHATSHCFHERVILPAGAEREAEVVEDSQLARLFATVIDVLDQAKPPFLVWVHAQAMQGAWDAPYAVRKQFAEEDDPDPPRLIIPPDCQLSDDYDPDELLGFQHAYAGQVALLDDCLGILLDALWSGPLADSTAVLATAARGYPMGEHRYVGHTRFPLQAELLQVPWIMHWPKDQGAMLRTQRLVQPPDMYPALLQWYGAGFSEPPIWGRDLAPDVLEVDTDARGWQACSAYGAERSIRVPAWFLRQGVEDDRALYVKPDDRWEYNEVSNRCGDVVAELAQLIEQFEEAARVDDRHRLPQLSESMVYGVE